MCHYFMCSWKSQSRFLCGLVGIWIFFFSFFLKVQLCYKEPEWQTVTVASRLCKYRYTVQCRAKDALVSIHFQSHDSLSLNVECTQRIHREWGGDGLVEDTGSEMDGNEKAGDRC